MEKQQPSSQPRRYRSWTKVSAMTYIGQVNRGENVMGLTFWSASDFLAKQGLKSRTDNSNNVD
jgi:hypothetical protein